MMLVVIVQVVVFVTIQMVFALVSMATTEPDVNIKLFWDNLLLTLLIIIFLTFPSPSHSTTLLSLLPSTLSLHQSNCEKIGAIVLLVDEISSS
jgi:hypothetical protein